MINEKRVLKEKNFFIPKIKTFYFITIVFQIARTLPHSIIVIFLLEKFGLDASFSLFFQISFFIPIFLFEIFSGYLSDILSRKYVYIFSIIFIIIGFSIIGFSNILSLVFFGYFLYGLSTALISGTIEVNFLNYIKDKFQNNKDNLTSAITIFSSNLRIINLVGMAIGGTIGSFIFVYLQNYLFLFSICFFVISLVVTLFFIPNSLQKNIMKVNKINIKIYTKDFMTSLKQESVKVTKKNFVLILLFAALLFFLLPYYST